MYVDQEIIEHEGKKYRRFCKSPQEKWIVGIDVAQMHDHTAVAVVRYSVVPLDSWTARPSKWEGQIGLLRQDTDRFFDLRALERLPNGVPYPQQAAHIERLLGHPELRKADVVVDVTGVGRPIFDLLQDLNLPQSVIGVTITSGERATRHGTTDYSVPKADIIGAVLARLGGEKGDGQLRFADNLSLLEQLREELQNFQLLSRSATGHEKYGAGKGHDDLVIALGLALWWGTSAAHVKAHGSVGARHVTY
jgi:hypothetical protein